MGNGLALREMNGPRCHVSDYDRDLVTAGFHVGVCMCNINSVW